MNEFLSNQNKDTIIKRSGCPIKKINYDEYEFIHKSFFEYFVACNIIDNLKIQNN